jgi:AcrR family transcriptional regulator
MDPKRLRKADDPSWADFLDDLSRRWRPQDERKQDRSRRRQHEILQAALRIFARDGIARARISDVAAEAGMPVSSIYEYYSSKEDLAYAVPLTQLGHFFSEYSERARQAKAVRERLRLYLWMTTDFARRNPEWARTLYLEIWPSVLVAEARVRTGLDEFAAIIVELVAAGEASGEWEAGPNRYETAAILIGSVNQLIITWLMYRRPRDINRAASSLVDRLLSSVLPPVRLGDPASFAPDSGPAASLLGGETSGAKQPSIRGLARKRPGPDRARPKGRPGNRRLSHE